MKPYLSVIIPVYNEAKRIPLTLVDVDKRLREAEYSSEIIVVDGGSRDSTVPIVKRFVKFVPNLRLIEIRENYGKGYVVRRGMLEAKGSFRLFMDADNSTTIDQFNNMLPFFKEGYEVVIGSRDIKGAKLMPPQPWYKRWLGDLGNILIQIVLFEFLRGIWDTQCGFKCFSEEAAQKIFRLSRLNRWGFDFEILALAKKMGYKIKEIPVTWINDVNSKVGLGGYFSTLRDLARVRWNFWRNKYNFDS